jgi:hypothetical protein
VLLLVDWQSPVPVFVLNSRISKGGDFEFVLNAEISRPRFAKNEFHCPKAQ